ncbi:MAG: hypothetical protein ABIE42_11350 [Candidatus Eisenbacteria bacterium]
MRLILICACVLALCVATHADVPRTMSYQGVLRDATGDIVPDDSYSVDFSIYDVEVGGTPLWTETQSVDVSHGLFHVVLGSSTALDIDFDVPYWLGIAVESEPELAPRSELTAAPYALRAAVADSVKPTAIIDDGDWEIQSSDVWHDGNVGVGPGSVRPHHPLEVTGDAYFYNDVYVAGSSNLDRTYIYDDSAIYDSDFSVVGGDLHVSTGEIWAQWLHPVGFFHITDTVTPFLSVDATNARVGIMTSSPGYALDVDGTVNCTGFRLPTGATSGEVLTSDATGSASWQVPYVAPLESGKFNCNADYALLVDCNGTQLLQNGARNLFRIHSNAVDASACYAYYLNGVQVARAVLSAGANYDLTIPTADDPHHVEVILGRPWAGGATARVDIYYDNNRCGGIWNSSH